jgi:hypothetical protein
MYLPQIEVTRQTNLPQIGMTPSMQASDDISELGHASDAISTRADLDTNAGSVVPNEDNNVTVTAGHRTIVRLRASAGPAGKDTITAFGVVGRQVTTCSLP